MSAEGAENGGPFFTQGPTIVLLLPVFVTEVADRIETQLLLPRIVTGPQLPNKVMVLPLPHPQARLQRLVEPILCGQEIVL